MRFGFDISSLPYGTGVSRYTSNVVRSLIPYLGEDQLVLFGSSLRQKKYLSSWCLKEAPSLAYKLYRYPPSILSFLFNQCHVNISRFTGQVDVFHAWDWYVPKVKPGTLVSTVHDLALFKYPDTAHPQIKSHHQKTLRYLQAQKAKIIAVSRSTKQDLIEIFQFDPDRIVVIPEALPQESALSVSPDEVLKVKQQLGITKPYFLMVGTLEKRKNYPMQIAAWLHFKKDYDLVIVGQPSSENIKAQPGIIICPQVDQTTLAALYQGSQLLLYASLYEGFGLPILEAFYHNIPVVTSKVSSMPEVAGEAAVLVKPEEPESIIIGIGKALQNRAQLIEQGIKQLQFFSWSQVAQDTVAVYRQKFIENL